ncbi:hypothetical protein pb186bvf_003784 [Paramecium bursaria]
MGTICQKTDTVIQDMNKRVTFFAIAEEESNQSQIIDKSQYTQSQFFTAGGEFSQRQTLGFPILNGQTIYVASTQLGRYLSSHSIRSEVHKLESYEVSIQTGSHEQLGYNEWVIKSENEIIQNGDCIQLQHKLSERYLCAIIIKEEGHVYTGRNAENWLIFFESKELMDNATVTIKHKETGHFLCSTYMKAQMPHNRLVQISDDEGRHTQWKISLA